MFWNKVCSIVVILSMMLSMSTQVVVAGTYDSAHRYDDPTQEPTVADPTEEPTVEPTQEIPTEPVIVYQAPVADSQAVGIDEDAGRVGVQLSALDADGDLSGYEILSTSGPGAVVSFDAISGALVYETAQDQNGAYTIDFAAVDSQGLKGNAQVVITINPVDDNPEASNGNVEAISGQPVSVALPAQDIDSSNLIYSTAVEPSNGSVVIDPSGVATYTSNAGFVGADSFAFAVSDSISTSQAVITVNVGPAPASDNSQLEEVAGAAEALSENGLSLVDENGQLVNDLDATNEILSEADPVGILKAGTSFTYGGVTLTPPEGTKFQFLAASTSNPDGKCVMDADVVKCYWSKPVQKAVDYAKEGTDIYLNGTFQEQVRITRSINLIGNSDVNGNTLAILNAPVFTSSSSYLSHSENSSYNSRDYGVIYVDGVNDVLIRNIKIDGLMEDQDGANWNVPVTPGADDKFKRAQIAGIVIANSSNIDIQNMQIQNFQNNEGCSQIKHGLFGDYCVDDDAWDDTRGIYLGEGIIIYNSDNVTVEHSVIDDTDVAIEIQNDSDNVTIKNNEFTDYNYDGIDLGTGSNSIKNDNLTIVQNEFSTNDPFFGTNFSAKTCTSGNIWCGVNDGLGNCKNWKTDLLGSKYCERADLVGQCVHWSDLDHDHCYEQHVTGVGDMAAFDNDDDGQWPIDNCPTVSNPSQLDTDGDSYGDACDSTPYGALPTVSIGALVDINAGTTQSVVISVADADTNTLSLKCTLSGVGSWNGPSNFTTVNSGATLTYTYSAPASVSSQQTVSISCQTKDTLTNQAGGTDNKSFKIKFTNHAPVANNDSYTISEDNTLTVIAANGVLKNDTDSDGNLLTAKKLTNPAQGSLTFNNDGTFTYVPVANMNGSVSFTYKANDGNLDSGTATVTITINSVNDAVTANGDSLNINEDATLQNVDVLANDSYADGLGSLVIKTFAGHGAAAVVSNKINYTPTANYCGSDSVVYTLTDTNGDKADATLSINISCRDDSAVASDDSASVSEDNPVTVEVLANDSYVDGFGSIAIKTNPSNGNVTVTADNKITYTPRGNYCGSDNFKYTLKDSDNDTSDATVAITVTCVNDAPVAVADSYSTNEDTTLTIVAPGVLGNDTDVDGPSKTAVKTSGVANGTLTFNANGSFTYVPNANWNGTDSFKYKAYDGTAYSNEVTVTITVNSVDDGVTANGDSLNINEDAVLQTVNVLANDSYADGLGSLVIKTAAGHGTAAVVSNKINYTPTANYCGSDSVVYTLTDTNGDKADATLSINISCRDDSAVASDDSASVSEDNPVTVEVLANDSYVDGFGSIAIKTNPSNGNVTVTADNKIIYTPRGNYCGSDSFKYTLKDSDNDTSDATVAISVTCVNDAPVAVADSYSTNEDTTLTINAPGVLGNDTDVDGPSKTAVKTSGVANGTLTFNANGSFTYVPNANWYGTDSFTYKAYDGTAYSNEVTVTITVNSVNDGVTANGDSLNINEDAVLQTVNVLANDSYLDGLGSLVIKTAAGHGTVAVVSNKINYTPTANYCGSDSVVYTLTDTDGDKADATLAITITCVDDPATAVNDSATTNEDNATTVDVLANDSYVDGFGSVAIKTNPANGSAAVASNKITYTPSANFCGSDSFVYTLTDVDGDKADATVAIGVTCVNDAPLAVADSYSTDEDTTLTVALPAVLGNDSDIDSAALTAVLVSGTSHGSLTLNANGSLSYTPVLNFNGTDSFTYKANDGALNSNTVTVTITVNAVNDAPVAAADSYSTDEDVTLSVLGANGVLKNDGDIDGDTLKAILVANVSHGALTLNADGSFQYIPAANYYGSDAFTYQASDGTLNSNTVTVTITVNSVNDAPAADAKAVTTSEDAPLEITLSGTDIDGTIAAYEIVSGPDGAKGTLGTLAGDKVTFSPVLNFNGDATFTYRVQDNEGTWSVAATATVTVTPVNDAPVATADSYSTDEDTPLMVALPGVLGNDSDVDSANLTAILVAGPSNGTLTLNADGSFTYAPVLNFNGTDSFTYKANDGALDSNTVTVTLTVNPVNDAPVAIVDSFSTDEDTTLSVAAADGVLKNDSDVDSTTLKAILAVGPSHGTLTLNDDGSFTYAPVLNFNGTDSFTYKAQDGALDSNTVTVTLTVNPVNDAPAASADSYSVNEDTILSIDPKGILGNDSDVDEDALKAILVTDVSHGTLALNEDGSFKYTPTTNYNGSDSFTYKANDGALDSNTVTVSITVNAVNDNPVALDGTNTTYVDTPVSGTVKATDVDSTNLTYSVTAAGQPTYGSVAMNPDGGYTYTPNATFVGTVWVTYTVCDDHSSDPKCDTGAIMIVMYPKAAKTGGDAGVGGAGGVGGLLIPVTGLAGGYQPLIAAGEKHTCTLTSGSLKCWGDNQYGQVGDGTKVQRTTPTAVKGLKAGIVAVVAGQNHSCALSEAGAVQCWGDNQYGQIGDGTKEVRSQATDVKGLSSGVVAISAGQNHTCALKNDGTVWCWGYNGEGQLNDGTLQNSATPVQTKVEGSFGYFSASMLDTYMMVGDKSEKTAGWLKSLMSYIDPLENMVSVYGARFTDGGCAVEKSTGDLYCWSENGKAEKVEGVTDMLGVSSGLGQTCGMTNKFALYCWGENASGQVGNGTTATQETPVEIQDITGGVVAVAAGYNHTCAVTGTNDVYCWGQNKYGQLGDDSTTDRTQPTLVIDVP